MTLGIYIPTYNRPSELRLQLRSLLPQMTDQVSLHVRDNASTSYDWETFRQEFSHPRAEFHQNACNIGGNANIALAFPLMGQHTYLWILSDNDLLTEEAVSLVLKELKEAPDLLVFGHTSDDYQATVNPGEGWNEFCPGLISHGVYRSEVFRKHAQYGFLLHNSSFPHLAVYYATAAHEGFRVKYSTGKIISSKDRVDGEIGDYSLALGGMPLLCYLFPAASRRKFLKVWIKANGFSHFFENKRELEFVTDNTRLLLRKYVLFEYLSVIVGGSLSVTWRGFRKSQIVQKLWLPIKKFLIAKGIRR